MFEDSKQVKQHCLNLAVKGLRNQRWEKCQTLAPRIPGGVAELKCSWSNEKPGVHCAVGHLLDHGKVKARPSPVVLTSQSVSRAGDLELFLPEIQEVFDMTVGGFLMQMQVLHDQAASPSEMEKWFKELTASTELTWPEEVING